MRFKEFNQFISETFSVTTPSERRGPEVADLQKALVALGYPLPKHGVDGIRGPETNGAIRSFQQDNQLNPTGAPDKPTVTKINSILATKPDIANKLVKSTAADVKPARGNAAGIDTTQIQDPDFNKKLDKVANSLGVSSKDLIAIMKQESGVNPAAVNKMSGATGLIQFMPTTAKNLGTSVEELRTMSAVDQLDYVYKYFKSVGVKPGMDLGDLYLAVFMPAAIGKGDNHVLGAAGDPGFSGKVYAQNKGLDKNKDGVITVADAKQSVARFA
jgi:peptidoglycan hydrolase-like protein with peptidoglycan-binding domain